MNKPLIPAALLLLTAVTVPVSAIEDTRRGITHDGRTASAVTTPATSSQGKPWYIGPKGGDVRKGQVQAFTTANVITNFQINVPYSAAANERPWYIGPKGGHTRKGIYTVSMSGTQVPTVPATIYPDGKKPWYIGPKGGDIRKGTSRR